MWPSIQLKHITVVVVCFFHLIFPLFCFSFTDLIFRGKHKPVGGGGGGGGRAYVLTKLKTTCMQKLEKNEEAM